MLPNRRLPNLGEPCEKGSLSNEIVSLSTSEKQWRHHRTEHGAQNHTAGRA
jgi:hypothetical protein